MTEIRTKIAKELKADFVIGDDSKCKADAT